MSLLTLLVILGLLYLLRLLTKKRPTTPLFVYSDTPKHELAIRSGKQHYAIAPDSEIEIPMAKSGLNSLTPITCLEVFRRAVEKQPDSPALRTEAGPPGKGPITWKTWTWKEYYDDTMCAARALVRLGVEQYGSVNIMGFNSPEWFIANMAAITAGAKSAGIYPTNGAEASHYIAEHSEAAVVCVENEELLKRWIPLVPRLPKLRALVVYGKPEYENKESKIPILGWQNFIRIGKSEPQLQTIVNDRIRAQKPGHCCTLIYTSGTTGTPKAVMISHDNITWTAQAAVTALPGGDIETTVTEERVISYLPLSHIAAQMIDIHITMCLVGVRRSTCCVYFARPDALKGSLGDTLKAVRPTSFLGVPRVWEKMEEKMRKFGEQRGGLAKAVAKWAKATGLIGYHGGEVGGSGFLPGPYPIADKLIFAAVRKALGLDQCKVAFSGAAPISKETLNYFGSLGVPICELYGMSECSGPQTISRVNYRKVGSCGPNMPGTELRIDHLDGRDKPGEGEICYRGRHIMMGYLKQEDKTREAIDPDGFLHSGDVGRVDRNGLLYITGRIKELLITAGGENVAPVPVEDLLKKELPGISSCMMVGDRRKFNSVLICIRTEQDLETGAFTDVLTGEARRVSGARTLKEALVDGAWKQYIQAGIDRTNRQAVSRAQHLQKFTILPTDFSVPGGELTATLKLKRAEVCAKYHKEIEAMYADAE